MQSTSRRRFIWLGKLRTYDGVESDRNRAVAAEGLQNTPGGTEMTTVLLVYRLPSPFVIADREIIRRHFDLVEFIWPEHVHPARELALWMFRNRRRYDVVFSWFGNSHASIATFAAWLERKPSLIQVGGYDVSDIPRYGFLSTRAGRSWARLHFGCATRILAVSHRMESTIHTRFPGTVGRTVVLPTGVDTERFHPSGPKTNRVLSVAPADSWPRASVKGLDRIAAVARQLPELPFTIFGVGAGIEEMLQVPSNLQVRGHVSQVDLIPEYQSAAVYLQPSRSEGMPNSVMEAMACGCVPVVTDVGGMRELVGSLGVVVPGRPRAIAEGVRRAMESPALGTKARERVAAEFSLRRREQRLVAVVEEVSRR